MIIISINKLLYSVSVFNIEIKKKLPQILLRDSLFTIKPLAPTFSYWALLFENLKVFHSA